MFRLIAINFSQNTPHFSLLSPTSLCVLSEREVTSPSNLKVVGAPFCKGPSQENCNQFCFQMDKWFQYIFTHMVLN